MDSLSTVETLCGAALPNGSQPMSASEMPMQTSSITLHRASTRYILLRISSGCFFLRFGFSCHVVGPFAVKHSVCCKTYKLILHHFAAERQSFRNFYII